MRLSKYSDYVLSVEEEAYLIDKEFALLNGYSEWEKSLPSWTLFQALSIFPEAKSIVQRELLQERRKTLQVLAQIDAVRDSEADAIKNSVRNYKEMETQVQKLDDLFFYIREGWEERLERIQFNLRRLHGNTPKGEIGDAEIAKAKEYPISELIEFRHDGKAKCLWHGPEKTPSLQYYPKENRIYCFSCNGKGWDSVDVVMNQEGVSFVEAVKILIGK